VAARGAFNRDAIFGHAIVFEFVFRLAIGATDVHVGLNVDHFWEDYEFKSELAAKNQPVLEA
jgi:hypothetical protein